MTRDQATAILTRIIGCIEDNAFPVSVHELYVFGSYLRGAANPNDLDLILIHAPSDPVTKPLTERLRREYGDYFPRWPYVPEQRFRAAMRKVLRKPGEKIDVIWGTSLEKALVGYEGATRIRLRIWSPTDRDWRGKLAGIRVDPTAGKYPRAEFANIKRFRTDRETMEEVTRQIADGKIVLTRIPMQDLDCQLNRTYQFWCDHWARVQALSPKVLDLLPVGMAWMQRQRGQKSRPPLPPYRFTMVSHDGGLAVYFGRPPLEPVLWLTAPPSRRPPGKPRRQVCAIPFRKRGEAEELFVFMRPGQR